LADGGAGCQRAASGRPDDQHVDAVTGVTWRWTLARRSTSRAPPGSAGRCSLPKRDLAGPW